MNIFIWSWFPIFPLINVCLFLCVFCVFVAIYIHAVFLSWLCAVRVAVCCVCCVSCMSSSLSITPLNFHNTGVWCHELSARVNRNIVYILANNRIHCKLCKPYRKFETSRHPYDSELNCISYGSWPVIIIRYWGNNWICPINALVYEQCTNEPYWRQINKSGQAVTFSSKRVKFHQINYFAYFALK